MFAIAFWAMVTLALVSSAFYFVMRIRLMSVDSARDGIEWLSFRSSDDVLNTYATLFPRSVLPRFCRFMFWTILAVAALALCGIIIVRLLGS